MRHAILGAGGVGGLVGAALARDGHDVVLLLRPETLERYGGRLAVVIPLLNGVDHVELLREHYPNVVAAAIRVESERVAPGRIRQASPFLIVDLAGAEAVGAELEAAGITVRQRDDERTLLWDKLAVLAPIALATTGLDSSYG